MTIYIPGGAILVFMSLYIFREYNRVAREKREERRENLDDIRRQHIQSLIDIKRARGNHDQDSNAPPGDAPQ